MAEDIPNGERATAWSITGCEGLPDGIYRKIYIVFGGGILLRRLKQHGDKNFHYKSNFGLYHISKDRLDRAVTSGNAAEVAIIDSARRLTALNQLSHRRRTIYEERIPIFKKMLDPTVLHELINEDDRSARIHLLSHEFGSSPRHIRELFHKLLDHGLDLQRAALTGHDRCGKKANMKHQKKQGRKRKLILREIPGAKEGRNVDLEIRQQIGIFARTSFDAGNSYAQNYRKFKNKFAVDKVQVLDDGDCSKILISDGEYITYDQFRYHLSIANHQNALSLKHDKLQKLSSRIARTSIGSARDGIHFPGQQLIIDSTVADVYLVCGWNRAKIIGRPIVYVVIDAATSLIVGLHITLYAPSADQAKIALFHSLTNKQLYLDRFDLGKYISLFPQAPVPSQLVYDRGELLSAEGASVANSLGVISVIPPAYEPKWKGIVERYFRTLNNYAIHWLPGSTKGRSRERGESDVRLDAVLTLHEFTKLILHEVLLWNLRGTPRLQLHPEYLVESRAPSLVDIWQWGLDNLHGSARYLQFDDAVVRLLQPKKCSISNRGIQLDRMRWVEDWMTSPQLTMQGTISKPMQLFRDPNSPTKSLVLVDNEQSLRPVTLASELLQSGEWTQEDYEEYSACSDTAWGILAQTTENFELAARKASFQLVDGAKKLTKQAHQENPQSKTARTKLITVNRETEKRNSVLAIPGDTQIQTSQTNNLSVATAGVEFIAALLSQSKG